MAIRDCWVTTPPQFDDLPEPLPDYWLLGINPADDVILQIFQIHLGL